MHNSLHIYLLSTSNVNVRRLSYITIYHLNPNTRQRCIRFWTNLSPKVIMEAYEHLVNLPTTEWENYYQDFTLNLNRQHDKMSMLNHQQPKQQPTSELEQYQQQKEQQPTSEWETFFQHFTVNLKRQHQLVNTIPEQSHQQEKRQPTSKWENDYEKYTHNWEQQHQLHNQNLDQLQQKQQHANIVRPWDFQPNSRLSLDWLFSTMCLLKCFKFF